MITNNAPAKMVLQGIVTGYKSAYIQHSIYSDYDVLGRSFWVTPAGGNTTRYTFTGIDTFFVNLNNLTENTSYSVQGAYYDSIIDQELLVARIGINLSDIKTFKTKSAPKITKVTSVSEQVDVGVGAPVIHVETTGEADYCTIELKSTATTGAPWVKYYVGALESLIIFGGVPVGTYRIRISGQVTMPDGVSIDSSGYFEWPADFEVKYNFVPPTAPKNMRFKVAQILDGKERYDVRVEWDWARENGANVREFVLYWIDEVEFAKSGWTKAQVMNVGAAQAATITSFPWNVPHRFRASSIAWGPATQDITYSVESTLVVNDTTVFDNSFINETGIELNYAYIKGSMNDNGTWRQTFLVDAKTGAINLGLIEGDGRAPISFDPVKKIVNVDGKVITRSINAASFILTNLTGEDNPALYTQGKSYGSNTAGIWMGMDNASAKPKVDIGNGTQYIRYDGDTLRISSGVVIGTPTGDIDLATGIQGKFTVFAYKLSTNIPSKPLDTNYPPNTWSTIPPNRVTQTDKIWVTTGTLDPATNTLVFGTSWSDVVQWSGSDGAKGQDGSQGIDGSRGPGFYSIGIGGLGSWQDGAANNFFQNNFGGPPTKYDVMTEYNANNPAQSFTRQWNGSGWGQAALVIHGDMIVNGTITSSKIVANDAFLSQIGVNTIYDRNAALSGNPEAVYKMKIDLASGYIHIR